MLELAEHIFTAAFTVEMALQVVARNFIIGPGAYMRQPWFALDGLIVATGLLSLGLLAAGMEGDNLSGVRTLRAMKPLRTISGIPGLRILMATLLDSAPLVMNVLALLLGLFAIFGIVGVQQFSGTMRYRCYDSAGTVMIREEMNLPCSTSGPYAIGAFDSSGSSFGRQCGVFERCLDSGANPNLGFTGFDTVAGAGLVIFQTLTLRGWTAAMEQVDAATGSVAGKMYFCTLVLLGSFFAMSLVAAVIIAAYDKTAVIDQKTAGAAADGKARRAQRKQPHWTLVYARTSGFFTARWGYQRPLRRLVTHQRFEKCVTGCIVLNIATMAMEHHGMNTTLAATLEWFNVSFVLLFSAELVLKIGGLGFLEYVEDRFNRFDLFIVVVGFIEILASSFEGIGSFKSTTALRTFRLMRVLRCLKILRAHIRMRALMENIALGFSVLANFLLVLFLFIFIFAVLGMHLFGGTKGFQGSRNNFDNLWDAFLLVFEMLTADNWYRSMWMAMESSGPMAAVYFLIWMFIGHFVLLNLFLAALVHNFSCETTEEKLERLERERMQREMVYGGEKLRLDGIAGAHILVDRIIRRKNRTFAKTAAMMRTWLRETDQSYARDENEYDSEDESYPAPETEEKEEADPEELAAMGREGRKQVAGDHDDADDGAPEDAFAISRGDPRMHLLRTIKEGLAVPTTSDAAAYAEHRSGRVRGYTTAKQSADAEQRSGHVHGAHSRPDNLRIKGEDWNDESTELLGVAGAGANERTDESTEEHRVDTNPRAADEQKNTMCRQRSVLSRLMTTKSSKRTLREEAAAAVGAGDVTFNSPSHSQGWESPQSPFCDPRNSLDLHAQEDVLDDIVNDSLMRAEAKGDLTADALTRQMGWDQQGAALAQIQEEERSDVSDGGGGGDSGSGDFASKYNDSNRSRLESEGSGGFNTNNPYAARASSFGFGALAAAAAATPSSHGYDRQGMVAQQHQMPSSAGAYQGSHPHSAVAVRLRRPGARSGGAGTDPSLASEGGALLASNRPSSSPATVVSMRNLPKKKLANGASTRRRGLSLEVGGGGKDGYGGRHDEDRGGVVVLGGDDGGVLEGTLKVRKNTAMTRALGRAPTATAPGNTPSRPGAPVRIQPVRGSIPLHIQVQDVSDRASGAGGSGGGGGGGGGDNADLSAYDGTVRDFDGQSSAGKAQHTKRGIEKGGARPDNESLIDDTDSTEAAWGGIGSFENPSAPRVRGGGGAAGTRGAERRGGGTSARTLAEQLASLGTQGGQEVELLLAGAARYETGTGLGLEPGLGLSQEPGEVGWAAGPVMESVELPGLVAVGSYRQPINGGGGQGVLSLASRITQPTSGVKESQEALREGNYLWNEGEASGQGHRYLNAGENESTRVEDDSSQHGVEEWRYDRRRRRRRRKSADGHRSFVLQAMSDALRRLDAFSSTPPSPYPGPVTEGFGGDGSAPPEESTFDDRAPAAMPRRDALSQHDSSEDAGVQGRAFASLMATGASYGTAQTQYAISGGLETRVEIGMETGKMTSSSTDLGGFAGGLGGSTGGLDGSTGSLGGHLSDHPGFDGVGPGTDGNSAGDSVMLSSTSYMNSSTDQYVEDYGEGALDLRSFKTQDLARGMMQQLESQRLKKRTILPVVQCDATAPTATEDFALPHIGVVARGGANTKKRRMNGVPDRDVVVSQPRQALERRKHKMETVAQLKISGGDPPPVYLKHRSLFMFSSRSTFRRVVFMVVFDKRYEYVILLLILVSSAALAADAPGVAPNSNLAHSLLALDLSLFIVFFVEFAAKVITMGLVLHPGAYLRSGWNVLDASVVLTSALSFLVRDARLTVVRSFRILRALRPLRMVRRLRGMQLVIATLVESTPQVGNVILFGLFEFVIFGILGVQLFGGKLWRCTDPTAGHKIECVGMFQNTAGIAAERMWVNPVFNFDHVFQAMMSLFVVSTMDGWFNMAHQTMDVTEVDFQPMTNSRPLHALYFVAFIVFVGFLWVNLLVAAIVDSYRRVAAASGDMKFTTVGQKEWIEALKMKQKQNADIEELVRVEPRFYIRKQLFRLVHHVYFEFFIMLCIFVNVLVMALQHDGQPAALTSYSDTLGPLFMWIFFLEMALKVAALSPEKYWKDPWNKFDFIIVLGSIPEMAGIDTGPSATIFRMFRMGRMFRVVKNAKGLRALFVAVVNSGPALANIGSLLFLLMFIFAILGMDLFGDLELGAAIDLQKVQTFPTGLDDTNNFKSLPNGLMLLFRVFTGDSWSRVMVDTMRCDLVEGFQGGDYATGCAFAPAPPVFFIAFIVLASFMLLNMFVAVILDKFVDAAQVRSRGSSYSPGLRDMGWGFRV
jgi:hypothetical protein